MHIIIQVGTQSLKQTFKYLINVNSDWYTAGYVALGMFFCSVNDICHVMLWFKTKNCLNITSTTLNLETGKTVPVPCNWA